MSLYWLRLCCKSLVFLAPGSLSFVFFLVLGILLEFLSSCSLSCYCCYLDSTNYFCFSTYSNSYLVYFLPLVLLGRLVRVFLFLYHAFLPHFPHSLALTNTLSLLPLFRILFGSSLNRIMLIHFMLWLQQKKVMEEFFSCQCFVVVHKAETWSY